MSNQADLRFVVPTLRHEPTIRVVELVWLLHYSNGYKSASPCFPKSVFSFVLPSSSSSFVGSVSTLVCFIVFPRYVDQRDSGFFCFRLIALKMAFSSLKSTSRRGTRYSTKPSSSAAKDQSCLQPRRKNPIRRPRSVSAASRSYVNGAAASPAAKKSSVSQFSNTRDNPLFSCSSSSSSEGEASEPVFEFGGGDSNGGRGRLVSRSSGNVEKTASNRSQSALILSRVSSGRLLRSTSIERFGYSMSKEEKDYRKTSILRVEDKVACSPKVMKDSGTTLEGYDAMKQTKNLQTWRSKHSVSDYFNALSVRSWEDGISTSSLSDLEVKTMRKNECRSAGVEMDYLYEIVRSEVHRAVSEIKCNLENAIRTNNFTVNAFDHALEMPPQLVNIDAVDCRAEYETMLKESQERAKKLRADLAVEEQHELEIDKILKGISLKETSSQKSKQRKVPYVKHWFFQYHTLLEVCYFHFSKCSYHCS
ncbi:hypothetical protein HPP92_026688 [Vanilla planifolia]|uniref:Uncharacterized protein n=1 Tax=Vanilla planifolia TaxID=51239 RepID=A0A835PFA3_VANPL|nr:hypothetical protein HPP92_026688 [Vanilla planifolia]